MKTTIVGITTLLTIFGSLGNLTAQESGRISNMKKPRQAISGSFYSLSLNQPPFPFNPFPDLPTYSIGDGRFVYDDRSVDYLQLWAELEATRVETQSLQTVSATTEFGSEQMLTAGSGLRLTIALLEGGIKSVSYDTQPGFVYSVQESTDLATWTPLETTVAEDTVTTFFVEDGSLRFYRVVQGDDRIQFPD